MMMSQGHAQDADDDESDDEYAEEDDVFDEDDDDKSHGGTDNDDDDNDDDNDDDDEDDDDNNTDVDIEEANIRIPRLSESAASESSLSLFLSRKKTRERIWYGRYRWTCRRPPPPHVTVVVVVVKATSPPLPPLRVENKRQTRRKAKTKKRSCGLVRHRNALTRKARDASKRVIIAWLRACVSPQKGCSVHVLGEISLRIGEHNGRFVSVFALLSRSRHVL